MPSLIPLRWVAVLACLIFWSAESANAADWPPQVDQYYKAGFTADKLPPALRASIAALDDRALPFKEMTYTQSAKVKLTNGIDLSIDTAVTVVPQGGSLVAIVGQDQSKEALLNFEWVTGHEG